MKTNIDMAREAGAAVGNPVVGGPEIIFPQCLDVQRFAALVRADEREECAKLVHDNALACDPGSMLQTYLASNAAAIRARGNT